ncbi:PhoH family protein [Aliikangiella coralliicola]|uniref:PhoH-like protein n=1 Tax=Aliikangiella coralliicola TaxID=2592383 RepID=A0A545UED8_9GAMM|nr:PhoH family protein [Aliikangiella coralliicola]TQV87839.1 PhoH family protein [Aliikangiella coralliicola]
MVTKEFILDPYDNQYLAILSGHLDENFRLLEKRLGVEINNRANVFKIIGEDAHVEAALEIIQQLYQEIEDNRCLTTEKLHLIVQAGCQKLSDSISEKPSDIVITTKKGLIRPRGINQQTYVENILSSDVTFGVGPAGTGKTYLAVAAAVDALERQEIRRILLTRPAVEAGEKLGFLPGDLNQKVDPYLRPLYDALYEMLGFERVAKLIERNVIEVAPLAYMRGRTLNDAFIIMDESQNTTIEQMKMFLTRIGFNSKAVITGDITQIDLPRGKTSGLRQAIDILSNVKGVKFSFFQSADVVRHPVVQRIVRAYEANDELAQKKPQNRNERFELNDENTFESQDDKTQDAGQA